MQLQPYNRSLDLRAHKKAQCSHMNVCSTFVLTKVGSRVGNSLKNLDQAAQHTQLQRDCLHQRGNRGHLKVFCCTPYSLSHKKRTRTMAQRMKHLLCRLENLSQIPSTHVHSQSSPDRTEKNTELRPTSEHTHARAYTCLNACVCIFLSIYLHTSNYM